MTIANSTPRAYIEIIAYNNTVMNVYMEPSWNEVLKEEFSKPYFEELTHTLKRAYDQDEPIYPPEHDIFNAFKRCPLDALKVVIIGQDPYHGLGQAHGLCFSVPDGVDVPPSLKNIYTEIHNDIGVPIHESGNLTRWADQGVFLLNTVLTVRSGCAGSHRGLGWELFTHEVIRVISEKKEHVVFLLWGKHAQEKGAYIDVQKHHILEAPHPSPLSAYRGFFGCKHFSKTNEYLVAHNNRPIVW